MILCQPHNPIGKMYTEKELTEIHNLATKHNVTIISDEIHADLTIQNPLYHTHPSIQTPSPVLQLLKASI